MSPDSRGIDCVVCESLTPDELHDFDALLVDPGAWPATLWEAIGKPVHMTPAARRYGQNEMGMAWLLSHGYNIHRLKLNRHIREHVVAVPRVEDLFAAIEPSGALLLADFLTKAMRTGVKALERLTRQLDDAEMPFSQDQLLEIAAFSAKIAANRTAALPDASPPPQLAAGGSGFMGPRPSRRVAHHRLREIQGESRIVADEGQRDRAHYNERADQEGGPRL